MILLLDTTVLLDVLRGSPKRRSLLAELVAGGHILSTAAVNIAEVYAGMKTKLAGNWMEAVAVARSEFQMPQRQSQ